MNPSDLIRRAASTHRAPAGRAVWADVSAEERSRRMRDLVRQRWAKLARTGAKALPVAQRREIARAAAAARWAKGRMSA